MVGSKHAGVAFVMSFCNSSSVYPTASRAAIFAIGNPVALLASALDRDTRGFISITVMRPFCGFTANCTLLPPVSTPISRITAIAASRIRWYSRSVSVCAGATVIESPVCTPIASKFSIEQMITTLSFRSRTTSSSYSFHPSTLSSSKHSCTGERSSPRARISINSSRLYAMPPPDPPSVKLGRITTGNPSFAAYSSPSRRLFTSIDLGMSSPIFFIASLNSSRSSAFLIASSFAPINSTPYFSSTPASARSTARFSAVCPPTVGSTAKIPVAPDAFSISVSTRRISSRYAVVNGSTYVRSATSGSVMIDAGFEFTSTTS